MVDTDGGGGRIASFVVSPQATITDEARSFDVLHQTNPHDNALKEKSGTASWPNSYMMKQPGSERYPVHTNTIEGYRSQFRTYLHTSHGWPADYLPLYLAECMFRSLHLPLSVALQAE